MPTPNDLDIIQISAFKFPVITNRPWRITQFWMNLILFINKHLQKSWSLTWFKKLRCRGILLNALPAVFLGSMYTSRLWAQHWGRGGEGGAKNDPTHSLSSRNLLRRFRANQCPRWYGNGPLARLRGSEILTSLLFIVVINGLRNNKAE